MKEVLQSQVKRQLKYRETILPLKVLGGDDEGDRETSCTKVNTEENWPESSQHLCEPISREEVSWALKEMQLQGLIVYIVMDMMLREGCLRCG